MKAAEWLDCAEVLADLMSREIKLLLDNDLAGAAGLADLKVSAAEAFSRAVAQCDPDCCTAVPETVERLGALAIRNQKLLSQAIGVQRRIVESVARAASPQRPLRYGPSGAMTAATGSSPVALLARA
ncbi:MAG: hypothetical protein JOY70_08625 [Acidisphaera sp.]|nr:hypothetical protein [Acidisphaera sp.]MBV9813521.1 hypothetical protein [Acetobacteraceae bacterium]